MLRSWLDDVIRDLHATVAACDALDLDELRPRLDWALREARAIRSADRSDVNDHGQRAHWRYGSPMTADPKTLSASSSTGAEPIYGVEQRPPLWLIADSHGARDEWQAAAEAAGLVVALDLSLAEGIGRIEADAPTAIVVLALSGEADAEKDRAVEAIDRHAERLGLAAIVDFPAALIDAVCARVLSPSVTLTCATSAMERAAALGMATIASTHRLSVRAPARDIRRLQQLADEVARIARTLADMSVGDGEGDVGVSEGLVGYRAGPASSDTSPTVPVTSGDIRALLRLRRRRDVLFGNDLFADPAWDMMLDLAAARLDGARVAVSSLCIAAAVPPTTALRWIRNLTELAVFERDADASDGRRVFIALRDEAASKIFAFLADAKRQGVLPL